MAVALHNGIIMSDKRVKIGVACPITGERAAFVEWLNRAEYDPLPMLDIDSLGREAGSRPIEALIADVSLVSKDDLQRVVKLLGQNRPLILVGDPEDCIEDVPRDATWIDRPVTRETFLLSVQLALAEGRPARRSPRRLVPKLLSSIDGMSSKIVDVSNEGVRLEINEGSPSSLPPYFTLRIPGFAVNAKVKRVWVATPKRGTTWCGGVIDQNAAMSPAWTSFLKNAPRGAQKIVAVS